MKYRITPSYGGDTSKLILWLWDRGRWGQSSLHENRKIASAYAKERYPNATLMDPEDIKNMEEDTPE